MAILKSIASGNLTAAATWGVMSSVSDPAIGNNHLVTTAYSGSRSASFTPGAITVSHIGIRLAQRNGTTGTFSIHIADNATFTEVAGTEVIINTADFPAMTTANNLAGGWMFFKLASPVTLLAATAYVIECKTSSSSQIRIAIQTTSTPSTMSRALVTTTTQAPVAGDDMNISGEYTGTGTSNSFTVTMNETATTDYGSGGTALNINPAMGISSNGSLVWATSASTNYYLKLSGGLHLYFDSVFKMGDVGAECPRTSTMTLHFDCVSNVDFGISKYTGATFIAQGLSRTSGKDVVACLLNTDEAVNSTSLGVDTDTGWLDNDEIVIASTTKTASQCETGTLNGNAGASTLTVDGFAGSGGGLAFAHDGTAPVQAEVILLTRNVLIRGTSSSVGAYFGDTSIAHGTNIYDVDWVRFQYFRNDTVNNLSGKRGIEFTGSFATTASFNYCAFTDSTTRVLVQNSSSNSSYVTINNCVSSRGGAIQDNNGATTASVFNITNHVFINGNNESFLLVSRSSIVSNIRVVGSGGVTGGGQARGVFFGTGSSPIGSFDSIVAHSNNDDGVCIAASKITISNITSYYNNRANLSFNASTVINDLTLSNVLLFGSTSNIEWTGSGGSLLNSKIYNLQVNGTTSFASTNGLLVSDGCALVNVDILNSDFSQLSGIYTACTNDINVAGTFRPVVLTLIDVSLGGTNKVANQSLLDTISIIGAEKLDNTNNNHRSWKRQGNLVLETGTVRTGTRSLAMKPLTATSTDKLVSNSFLRPVANGASLTPSVYVYEDASYNGNRARLILKRNDAIGITSDTVIATATAASDGAWEQLTGTTALATDNGVMEFVVDCDGTAGNLFVDDFSV